MAIAIAALRARAKFAHVKTVAVRPRVSTAMALARTDLTVNINRLTLRVGRGMGDKARIAQINPELQTALASVLGFADVGVGRIVEPDRSTA